MKTTTVCTGITLLALAAGDPALVLAAPGNAELVDLLKRIDERQRNVGDWRSQIHIEQKQQGKVDLVYRAVVMRRSDEQKFVLVFTAPKESQGQGYLRIDRNLWFYEPSVGKWERRTEHERLAGTNSRRSDFDQSRLVDEYDPADGGEQKIGAHQARVVSLKAKAGIDVAFPIVKLWVDKQSGNPLKRQDFALSGRLTRTSYYPTWSKFVSASNKQEVWYPQEIRVYDEIEKGNSTLILFQAVDARPLEANVFTKAWLESQSR
jgi:outer membrane lipoprotein-sorting protein